MMAFLYHWSRRPTAVPPRVLVSIAARRIPQYMAAGVLPNPRLARAVPRAGPSGGARAAAGLTGPARPAILRERLQVGDPGALTGEGGSAWRRGWLVRR